MSSTAERTPLPSFTLDLDEAMRKTASAAAGERQHVSQVARQIVVALGIDDQDAVWAFARSLQVEADGGWQAEHEAIWSMLRAEQDGDRS